MKKQRLVRLWALLLGLSIVLFTPLPAQAELVFSPAQGRYYSAPAVLEDLTQVDVVYLGETHDSPEDHQAQLRIIQALVDSNDRVAIALEMFQRPYQSILDDYLAGKITEAQLRQQTEYDQRWSYPWEYYAPILRFAKQRQLRLIALNTPTEVTRQVAKVGLDNLTPAERRWIPPLAEIRTDNLPYRQRVQQVYEDIHQGQSVSSNFEHFFQAQVLWDETMAEAIAQFLQANPKHQVVVLAGQAHIIYGDGIPDRVARRMANTRNFEQRSLLLNPSETAKAKRAIADYFWIRQPSS